jgi:Na+-driven multidrug efflux pump
MLTKDKKIIWMIGNIGFGVAAFLTYLWGALTAWGQDGNFWVYPIGSVIAVLVVLLYLI